MRVTKYLIHGGLLVALVSEALPIRHREESLPANPHVPHHDFGDDLPTRFVFTDISSRTT